jgi:uncharacterized membrane protein YfcA
MWPTIAAASVGVVCGTLFGHRILIRIPEESSGRSSGVLAILGAAMLIAGLWGQG